MQLKETQKVLEAFKDFVIQQARTRLTKNKKNVSKELYNSLKGNVKEMPNSIAVDFEMEDYGIFQDKGVSGTEKKYNTPYSYKSSSKLIGLEYHTGTFAKWAKSKGYQPRLKNGQYGSYKQMGYMMAINKKKYGIKPSLFFTKPFEQGFKKLPDELINSFGLDVEDFLAFALKQDRLKNK
jgi:hypothetical protein